MDKKKKLSVIAIALGVVILVLVAVLIYGLTGRKGEDKKSNTASVSATVAPDGEDSPSTPSHTAAPDEDSTNSTGEIEDDKVYTPTFMYFISNNDATLDEEKKVFNELKAKYDGKVSFDMCNIDEYPERAKNFNLGFETPYLIMLNTKNDICALENKCVDKAKLTADIEKALEGE